MAGVVQALMVELDARTSKLEAALLKSQGQLRDFQRATTETGVAGGVMGQRYASGALRAAGALESMARAGEVAGQGAKAVIAQGAQMAFAFGPGGALVGALGVATLAVVQLFTRAREEAERARKELAAQFKQIAQLGKDAAAQALNDEVPKLTQLQAAVTKAKADLAAAQRALAVSTAAPEGAAVLVERRSAALTAATAAYAAQEQVVAALNAQLAKGIEVAENVRRMNAAAADASAAAATTDRDRIAAWQALIDLGPDAQRATDAVTRIMAEHDKQAAARVKGVEDVVTTSLALVAKYTASATAQVARAFDAQIAEVNAALAAAQAAGDAASVTRLLEVADNLRDARDAAIAWKTALDAAGVSMQDIGNAAKGTRTDTGATTGDLKTQATVIAEAARGVLELAGAFGAVNDQVASVLRGVVAIAANVGPLHDAITGKAGFGAVAGAALPVVGGIVAIASSLFGGGPEAAAARAAATKAARDAADALERLATRAGDLADSTVSGSQLTGARRAVAQILPVARARPFLSLLGAQNVGLGDAGMAQLQMYLHAAGLTFAELQDVAKSLGVALSDMPTVAEIEHFNTALTTLDLKAFTETFAGQLDALGQSFEIFGITDPTEKFAGLVALLTDKKVGAPALFSAIAGLDITSADGINKARAKVQDLFNRAVAGTITAAELGGLSLSEFLQALQQLTGYLNEAAGAGQVLPGATAAEPGEAGTFNTVVSRATAVQADRMVDELTTIRTILDARLPALNAPLTAPNLAIAGAPRALVTIEQHVEITGALDAGAARTAAGVLADEVARQVNAALGRLFGLARTHAGSSLVS